MMKRPKRFLRLYLTGFTMGIADLTPGVSGGTIAFLAGIYEELLRGLQTVTGTVPVLLARRKFTEAFREIPFRFFLPLGLGVATALFGLAHVMIWLLREHPVFVWAFFFGLVAASVFVVLKRVTKWSVSGAMVFGGLAAVTYLVVGAVPLQTPGTLPLLFVSGMVAITAMMLPGISGALILVLLGRYHELLEAVVQRDALTLFVFALGALAGVALFARLLLRLLTRYHDLSIAALSGLMAGSLRAIWPWKEAERNVMPEALDAFVLLAFAAMVLGVFLVWYLDKRKLVKEQLNGLRE